MNWNEVLKFELKGNRIVFKDAMIMLGENESSPEWPFVECEPGEYIFEINVPTPFYAHRARVRRIDSRPAIGKNIGQVEIDNAYLGIIDYETFLDAVNKKYAEYDDWTVNELFDELDLNFSGEIEFIDSKLFYIKSGDGDGSYECFELMDEEKVVGIECVFIDQ